MPIDMNDLKNEIISRSGVNPQKCMRCGKCTATCPAYDEMEFPPHKFVYMVECCKIDELLKSKTIYKCLSCFACIERCPRQVEPAKLIEAIRLTYIRTQGCDHITPDTVRIDDSLPQQAYVSAYRKYKG